MDESKRWYVTARVPGPGGDVEVETLVAGRNLGDAIENAIKLGAFDSRDWFDMRTAVRAVWDVWAQDYLKCRTCVANLDYGMGPSHDASLRCRSGRRVHCTCDTCF